MLRQDDTHLNGRFVKMTEIRSGLSGLLSQHHHVGVNQSKCIDDNFSYKQKVAKNVYSGTSAVDTPLVWTPRLSGRLLSDSFDFP